MDKAWYLDSEARSRSWSQGSSSARKIKERRGRADTKWGSLSCTSEEMRWRNMGWLQSSGWSRSRTAMEGRSTSIPMASRDVYWATPVITQFVVLSSYGRSELKHTRRDVPWGDILWCELIECAWKNQGDWLIFCIIYVWSNRQNPAQEKWSVNQMAITRCRALLLG